MSARNLILSFAIVMGTAGGSIAGTAADLGAFEMRQGPILTLVSSGIDEHSAVHRRHPAKGSPSVQTATIEVTFIGFSAEAQAPFQAAVDVWSSLISSPITIRIEATWTPLDDGVLGQAGSLIFRSGLLPDPNTFYPEPLADALFGDDIRPGEFDITAEFNSTHGGWYLGTDGNTPPGQTDFMTVVLHELGHGLGFLGLANVDAGMGSWGDSGFPSIYDRFTQDGSGNAIINTDIYPNPSVALADVLQGDNLFWGGSHAVTVNGGMRPRLWAPASWEAGSSYSHLDEFAYQAGNPHSLMTPQLGSAESIHDPGLITLCIFQDVGWTTAANCGGGGGGGGGTNYVYWVPAAVHAQGAQSSQWRIDLGTLNVGTEASDIAFTLHTSSGTYRATSTNPIQPGAQGIFLDLVGQMGLEETGHLEVVTSQPFKITARIFNQAAAGTFGQFMDGYTLADGLTTGQEAFLSQLAQNANFRANVGAANMGTTAAVVRFTMHRSDGVEVGSFDLNIPPGQWRQDGEPFRRRAGLNNLSAAYVKVRVLSGSGIVAYASVVDNRTNDATTFPMKRE